MQSTKLSSRRHPRLALAAGVVLGGMFCPASGQPTFDLMRLIEDADVILVGQTTSVRDIGPSEVQVGGHRFPARAMEVMVDVHRVLKGGNPGLKVGVRFTLPRSPAGSIGYSGIRVRVTRCCS